MGYVNRIMVFSQTRARVLRNPVQIGIRQQFINEGPALGQSYRGSPQQIADQIARPRNAGVNYVPLNPVFDEETQMERLCEDILTHV